MKLTVGLAVSLLSGVALAQESAPTTKEPKAPTGGQTQPTVENPPPGDTSMTSKVTDAQSAEERWDLALAQVPWTEPAGRGFAVGYSLGSWGNWWAQNLQIHIPFALQGGVVVRGIAMRHPDADRWHLGGRLELRGQGPVYLNLVRIYGGGGVQLLTPVSGVSKGKAKVGGGGYFGFEFFNARWASCFIEIGGQGGGPAPGATIMAGIQLYVEH